MVTTSPGVTGRLSCICVPGPPLPPTSLSFCENPDPPPAPRATTCRLVTPSGTVNDPNPTPKLLTTGAAADADALAANGTITPSTTIGPSAPSTRLALVLSQSQLRAAPANMMHPDSSMVCLVIGQNPQASTTLNRLNIK